MSRVCQVCWRQRWPCCVCRGESFWETHKLIHSDKKPTPQSEGRDAFKSRSGNVLFNFDYSYFEPKIEGCRWWCHSEGMRNEAKWRVGKDRRGCLGQVVGSPHQDKKRSWERWWQMRGVSIIINSRVQPCVTGSGLWDGRGTVNSLLHYCNQHI